MFSQVPVAHRINVEVDKWAPHQAKLLPRRCVAGNQLFQLQLCNSEIPNFINCRLLQRCILWMVGDMNEGPTELVGWSPQLAVDRRLCKWIYNMNVVLLNVEFYPNLKFFFYPIWETFLGLILYLNFVFLWCVRVRYIFELIFAQCFQLIKLLEAQPDNVDFEDTNDLKEVLLNTKWIVEQTLARVPCYLLTDDYVKMIDFIIDRWCLFILTFNQFEKWGLSFFGFLCITSDSVL